MTSPEKVVELRHSGIDGLDRVLRGGIPYVRRIPQASPSASVLIKGTHGVGKTLLAERLAASAAHESSDAVLVACIEVLPTEIIAALNPFPWAPTRRLSAKDFEESKPSPTSGGPLLYVNSLRLVNEAGDARSPRDQISDWLDHVESAGFRAKAVVVDSLSKHYQMGVETRPEFASLVHLCAERGILLVLVQEVSDSGEQWISFVPDIVIGLRWVGGRAGHRALCIEKARFAPFSGGDHIFELEPNGEVFVWPNLSTYRGDKHEQLAPPLREPTGIPALDRALAPKKFVTRGTSLVVQTNDPLDASGIATCMLKASPEGALIGELEVSLRVILKLSFKGSNKLYKWPTVGELGDPPEEIIGRIDLAIGAAERETKKSLARIVVSDLAATEHFPDGATLVRGLLILPQILRRSDSVHAPAVVLVHSQRIGESPWGAIANSFISLGTARKNKQGVYEYNLVYRSVSLGQSGTVSFPAEEVGLTFPQQRDAT